MWEALSAVLADQIQLPLPLHQGKITADERMGVRIANPRPLVGSLVEFFKKVSPLLAGVRFPYQEWEKSAAGGAMKASLEIGLAIGRGKGPGPAAGIG